VIYAGKVPTQQVMHPSIAKAAPLMGNIHNATAQGLGLLTGLGIDGERIYDGSGR
jgi:hypothetical protein